MRRKHCRRPTKEERIKQEFFRLRRQADYNARRRAARFTTDISDVNRMEILEREGRVCYLCGRWMSVHEMTIDHVVPLSKGGAHTEDNIRLAHKVCNSRKGERLMSELDLSKF